MESRKITLTIPEPIFKKLENEKKKYAFLSVQEIIVDSLRDKYFRVFMGKSRKGRPRKIREEKLITKKKIFDKKGVAISV